MGKRVYVLAVALFEAAGFTVGLLIREGTQLYATSMSKPPLSPPAIVFPIAWTILYALMAIGAARIYLTEPSEMRSWGITLSAFQLVVNLTWCFVFFGYRDYGLALIELLSLIVIVLAMILTYKKLDTLAARLQIPYLVWLCFAAYLNAGVLVLA